MNKHLIKLMKPLDDFAYLVNHVLLGDEPSIEDFILLIGTLVAFVAFILWCFFPIQPKDSSNHRKFSCKTMQQPIDGVQLHKGVPLVHNDYTMKNDYSYHYCT